MFMRLPNLGSGILSIFFESRIEVSFLAPTTRDEHERRTFETFFSTGTQGLFCWIIYDSFLPTVRAPLVSERFRD